MMTLHTPDDVTFMRGSNDPLKLESLFKALEMKSLVPRVSEFAPGNLDIL